MPRLLASRWYARWNWCWLFSSLGSWWVWSTPRFGHHCHHQTWWAAAARSSAARSIIGLGSLRSRYQAPKAASTACSQFESWLVAVWSGHPAYCVSRSQGCNWPMRRKFNIWTLDTYLVSTERRKSVSREFWCSIFLCTGYFCSNSLLIQCDHADFVPLL